MPIFLGMLGQLLVGLVGSIVGRVIVSLGMAVVYYRGLDVALDWLYDRFYTEVYQLPLIIQQIAGVLQISTCVNIMFATIGVRFSILGLNSDGFKKWVLRA
jgi:hypothetical protein